MFWKLIKLVFSYKICKVIISINSNNSYYFTSVNDWKKLMTLIIRHFLWVMPSFTKQLYKDFKSMQKTIQILA